MDRKLPLRRRLLQLLPLVKQTVALVVEVVAVHHSVQTEMLLVAVAAEEVVDGDDAPEEPLYQSNVHLNRKCRQPKDRRLQRLRR